MLGPGWRALAVTTLPGVFHLMPRKFRVEIVRRFLGPAASWPARQIVEGHVPFVLGANLDQARVRDGKVVVDLRMGDGSGKSLVADHVIAATGYRVDMTRYELLDKGIRQQLALEDASPALNAHFESSVPGLYFTGTAAANAFGPMFRFVCGSGYTARKIAPHVVEALKRRDEQAQPDAPAAATPLSGKQV